MDYMAYMAYGFVDKAMALFREIKNPGLSTWNALIFKIYTL